MIDLSATLNGNLTKQPTATVQLENDSTAVAGTADFYASGLSGNNQSVGSIGLRAVGVQSFDDPGNGGEQLVFAVNTFGRTSNPATTVYDLLLDVNGDGIPDYDVEAADYGLLTTGSANGTLVVAVFNLNVGGGVLEYFAVAPTDGSVVLLQVVAADVGITSANPRFSYVAQTTDLATGNIDVIGTPASFNAFTNAISTGAFESLGPGAKSGVVVSVNAAEFKKTPALGVMVVSLDNMTGAGALSQALLLNLGAQGHGH